MKPTAIFTTAAALAIFAPAASAEHKYSTDRVILTLAADVEYYAGEAYHAAGRVSRHDHRSGYRALGNLRALDREARHFNRQVRRYSRDPFHSSRDFERLRVSFYAAHATVPTLYGYQYVEREFYALADAMRRLEYAFLDLGYRYRRPFPRLSFRIDIFKPYHRHRHGIYRKPYRGGYLWYGSYDSHRYRHGRKDYGHDGRKYYGHGKKHYKKGNKHHRQGKHYQPGHGKKNRHFKDDRHYDRHDDDRRGSARRTRPRR